jgi:outer membrane lipoprotein-sorting protein
MTRISTPQITVAVFTLLSMIPRASSQSVSSQTRDSLPSAEDIVARMTAREAEQRAALSGYSVMRQYEVVNKNRHAEMLVQLVSTSDGAKQFSILREDGSGSIRKHVFRKILEEETNASHGETREGTRIAPANYSFHLVGTELVNGRPAYLLEVTPKSKSKYLIRGRIWVDATDYAIVRVEGSPAENPSFWIKSVHFVHTYRKVGDFWFAASTTSVTEVRIFGTAKLSIEEFEQSPRLSDFRTADLQTASSARP